MKDPKRIEMAAQGEATHEYEVHSAGYVRFLRLMKWGTILSFLTGAIVVLLIAS